MSISNVERSQNVIQNIKQLFENNENTLENNYMQRKGWIDNFQTYCQELKQIIDNSNDLRQAYKIHLQMIHTEMRNVLYNEKSIHNEITRYKGDNPLFQID